PAGHGRVRSLDLAPEDKRVDHRRAMVVVRALKAGPLEPGETLPHLRNALFDLASLRHGPSLRAERRRRPGAAERHDAVRELEDTLEIAAFACRARRVGEDGRARARVRRPLGA